MTEAPPVLLLIADISGFTQFMRLHAIATSHSKQIVVRLLKAIVAASGPPLRLAELEGDAVFLWAPVGKDRRVDPEVRRQLLRFFAVFHDEVAALQATKLCVCEACVNVGMLKLKQVVHVGEAATERIDRFEKLFGIDVIVVHRMLKNSVPCSEYILLSERAYETLPSFADFPGERRVESLDGVDDLPTVLIESQALRAAISEARTAVARAGRLSILGWKLAMHARTLVELPRSLGRRASS